MLDAGSGFPPHWRGDAGDISLATAQAMQAPTERQLRKRQSFFIYLLEDILYHAYQRSISITNSRPLKSNDYSRLFMPIFSDISRWDNESLARSAHDIAQAFQSLTAQITGLPPTFAKHVLRTTFKFAGEPVSEEALNTMLTELYQNLSKIIPEDQPSSPPVEEQSSASTA